MRRKKHNCLSYLGQWEKTYANDIYCRYSRICPICRTLRNESSISILFYFSLKTCDVYFYGLTSEQCSLFDILKKDISHKIKSNSVSCVMDYVDNTIIPKLLKLLIIS